jgi:hypothetical protein
VKACSHIFLLLLCSLSASFLTGCEQPPEPNEGNITVSGETYLRGSADPTSGVTVKCAGLSTISGTDGAYCLVGVPEGRHVLSAEREDCLAYSDTITVTSNTKQYIYLTLKPPRTCRIWGYISNPVDGPIAGGTVRMQDNVVSSDSSGRYELPPMLYHSDTLFVSRKGYVSSTFGVSLDSSQKQIDVSLVARQIITVNVSEDAYVDERNPAVNFGSSLFLLLSSNAPGQRGNERNIYLNWEFPQILRDERRTVTDAALQLILSSVIAASAVETYLVASFWSGADITYSTQPIRGAIIGTTTTDPKTKLVVALSTPAVNQLLADWRAHRPSYGVVVQGGPSSGTPASFNSTELGYFPAILRVTLQY